MENATFRSIHGSKPSNGSISTSPPIVSPRKPRGVMRTISSGDAPDEPFAKDKEKSRFFRVFSPKKAMARKAQAKKKQGNDDLVATLTPESMDAIGVLPFENNQDDVVRGRVAARRCNITPSSAVLRELVQEAEEESSVELDDVVLDKEVQTEKNIVLPALHASPTPPRTVSPRRGGSGKSPRRQEQSKTDFQASMDIGELFSNVLEDSPASGETDEMMAMAMERSKKDFRRAPPTSPMRKKRDPLLVVDETQSWTAREQRKVRERNLRAERVESARRSGRPSPSDEELRLIEEEQEREMIELALARSLADAKQQERQEQVADVPSRTYRSPHRVPYDRDEIDSDRLPQDEEEAAKREEEMIRRAMEMSMHDF